MRNQKIVSEFHQLAFVDENRQEQIPSLTGSVINVSEDSTYGYQIKRNVIRLAAANRGYVTAGLTDALLYDFLVQGKRAAIGIGPQRPLADHGITPSVLGPRNSHIMSFIQQYARGIIRHRLNRADLLQLITQIAAAFQTAIIRVVVATDAECEVAYRALRCHFANVGFATKRYAFGLPSSLVVASLAGLGRMGVLANVTDILLFTDAPIATSERAQISIIGSPRARVFGLMSAQNLPSPSIADRLIAVFGFDRVDVPKLGCKYRLVTVYFAKFIASLEGPIADGHKCLKKYVWHSALRNRIVASTARELADSEIDPADALRIGARGSLRIGAGRTVVFVATQRHVDVLGQYLPRWQILNGNSHLRAAEPASRSSQNANRLLSTIAGLEKVDLATVDTLIWAGSGPHSPAIPDSSLIVPADHDRDLHLIDIADRHHPLLRRWSRQRRKEYEEREWFAHGVDPVIGRIKRFLAARPEVINAI